MTKKPKIPQKRKRVISTKKWAIISISIAVIILLSVFAISYFLSEKNNAFSLNAGIIDQLAKTNPNSSFKENATAILKEHGFSVEYYCNDTIDINFFRSLAERRFGIIILRVHTALREDGSTVDLFTNEKWDPKKYRQEREKGLIVYGNYSNDPNYYCAITYRFIESFSDHFPKSIIFSMGCWSLKMGCEQLAQAFIKKGAKAYIGWTDVIQAKDTDAETLNLLEMLLRWDYPLGYAVRKTKPYNYTGVLPDGTRVPIISRLRLYPDSAEVSSLKLSELINEAKATFTQFILVTPQPKFLPFKLTKLTAKVFTLIKTGFTAFLNV